MTRLIDFGSFTVNFLKSRHETGGSLDMFELTLSSEGRMPVPHYHEDWEETVYGVEGVVTYTIGGERCDIGPGESAFVPRGVVHGFSNHTGASAKCLCVLTPGRLGPEYFEELAAETRPLIYACSAIMIVALAIPLAQPTVGGLVGYSFLMGAGFGGFASVDYVLITKVLPSRDAAGKDLGIINMTTTLSQTLGVGLAGAVVSAIGTYSVLFPMGMIFVGLGAGCVALIRGVR